MFLLFWSGRCSTEGEMLWNQQIVPVFAGKSGGSAMYKIYNLSDNHKSIAKAKCLDRTALFQYKIPRFVTANNSVDLKLLLLDFHLLAFYPLQLDNLDSFSSNPSLQLPTWSNSPLTPNPHRFTFLFSAAKNNHLS